MGRRRRRAAWGFKARTAAVFAFLPIAAFAVGGVEPVSDGLLEGTNEQGQVQQSGTSGGFVGASGEFTFVSLQNDPPANTDTPGSSGPFEDVSALPGGTLAGLWSGSDPFIPPDGTGLGPSAFLAGLGGDR